MRITVSGASGLVGSALTPALRADGHTVVRLTRGTPGPGSVAWDPAAGTIDHTALAGCEAVVHLAGENIAAGRWTAAAKARIRESRVRGTALLAETLARLQPRPQTLVCASATGWYGDRGAERLTETSAPGTGFLPDVCQAWEAAAEPARAAGIRVAHLRFGVVLSPRGGALAKMLPPFRCGVGGRLGTGAQVWSWVTLDDVVGAVRHALATPALTGPVNVTAPTPVRATSMHAPTTSSVTSGQIYQSVISKYPPFYSEICR